MHSKGDKKVIGDKEVKREGFRKDRTSNGTSSLIFAPDIGLFDPKFDCLLEQTRKDKMLT